MKDQQILKLFRNGQREKAFKKLYPLYPRIEKIVLSLGGDKSDAQDVFQEALIILHRKLESEDFALSSSLYTYLYSVSKFVYKDLQRKFSREKTQEFDTYASEAIQSVVEERKYRIAENAFLSINERCQRLLKLFYIQRQSYEQIAQKMGFVSERGAKNQKYKCLKKAREVFHYSFKNAEL